MTQLSARGIPYLLGSEPADEIDDYTRSLRDRLDNAVPYRIAAGSVTFSVTSGEVAEASVTFPTGRFTIPPHVFVAAQVTAGGTVIVGEAVGVTATGFTLRAAAVTAGTSQGTYTLAWRAEQMTAGSNAG